MGDRIKTLCWIVRTLRSSEQPRYTFTHAVANILMGAACIVLTLLGELRMWAMLAAVLTVSIGVYGFRALRFMRRKQREYERMQREEYERMLED